MKKTYQKPIVVVENFELTEHIASCGSTTVGSGNAFGKPNHYGGTNCEFKISDSGGIALFLESNNECTMEVQVDEEGNLVGWAGCYNTPDGNISMFAS